MAFVLAVILTAMVGYDKPVISSVEEGCYSAAEAGIQEGDTIVRMGGKKINIFREITYYNQFHQGETVKVTYLHDGEKHTATLVPKMDDELGYYRIGISGGGNTKANAWTSVQYGAYEVKFWVCTTFESLKQLVTGNVGVKQLSGSVGIVNMVDTTYNESKSYGVFIVIAQFLNIGILLSANLGVMNLLPLPALDGGRLVFLLIEAIRRKRIPPEKEGYVHLAGMALLMILMVVVMYNDIARIFFLNCSWGRGFFENPRPQLKSNLSQIEIVYEVLNWSIQKRQLMIWKNSMILFKIRFKKFIQSTIRRKW